jgi:hypothetical protein
MFGTVGCLSLWYDLFKTDGTYIYNVKSKQVLDVNNGADNEGSYVLIKPKTGKI